MKILTTFQTIIFLSLVAMICSCVDSKEVNEQLENFNISHKKIAAPKAVSEDSQPTSEVLVDSRDSQTYQIVQMKDGKTWMAENLNFKTESDSYCYDNHPDNCEKYGRLYTWEAAKNACPEGWRLPAEKEWRALLEIYGGVIIYEDKKKIIGDPEAAYQTLTTNEFQALRGGHRDTGGDFGSMKQGGYYWSATEDYTGAYWGFHFHRNHILEHNPTGRKSRVMRSTLLKNYAISCRCVRD